MLNDNVLLEEVKNDITAGGIHMPDIIKTEFSTGKVVSVGPGLMLETGIRADIEVKVGDRVQYITNKAYNIEVDGKPYKVTNESCIVGIV